MIAEWNQIDGVVTLSQHHMTKTKCIIIRSIQFGQSTKQSNANVYLLKPQIKSIHTETDRQTNRQPTDQPIFLFKNAGNTQL